MVSVSILFDQLEVKRPFFVESRSPRAEIAYLGRGKSQGRAPQDICCVGQTLIPFLLVPTGGYVYDIFPMRVHIS
jgi:hypothetical protein